MGTEVVRTQCLCLGLCHEVKQGGEEKGGKEGVKVRKGACRAPVWRGGWGWGVGEPWATSMLGREL